VPMGRLLVDADDPVAGLLEESDDLAPPAHIWQLG
jgi:hypothetical protein